jgi:hypothetical protein
VGLDPRRLAGRGRGWRGLLLTLVVLACHHGKRPTEPAPDDKPADVLLDVINHNWLDVIIYVVHDGARTRVGTASASSQSNFTLPARLLGQGREIRLLGHPIGGSGRATTETLVVQPGQWIEWTLESDLARSSVGVF